MKIYITYTKDSFTDEQIKILEESGNVVFLEKTFNLDEAPYLKDQDDKILAVDPDWYNWEITGEHLNKIPNLKAVCLATTAFDWIDLDYCKNHNIKVCSIPKYSTDSVAEYAVFLMFCLAKKFPIQAKANYQVDYTKNMLTSELRNKTIGIVGLGTISTRIAEICAGLGMNVMYWNRSLKENNYQKTDLETIFKKADFIFPGFSTNDETKKIITDDLINMMNGNALINVVNNSKEIFNHNLCLELAKEEKISYAFEAYDDKRIKDYEGNVMVTAPYAFYTKEAIDRLIAIWVDNVVALSKGEAQNEVI